MVPRFRDKPRLDDDRKRTNPAISAGHGYLLERFDFKALSPSRIESIKYGVSVWL